MTLEALLSSARRLLRACVVLSFVCAVSALAVGQDSAPTSRPRVLFLTHSAGFRHDVVARPAPDQLAFAEEALVAVARGRFDVVATQDCGAVAAARLKDYAAVVFYTTGELPVPAEDRAAFVAWVEAGGAFVGVHPATDTYYAFPQWADFIGGVFDGHPWHEKVGVFVDQPTHPSAVQLERRFDITDEIYQFRDWKPEPVRVVLRLDPASIDVAKGKRADREYALAWARPYGLGRVFYTALGHRPEVWQDRRFLDHLLGGLDWATGRAAWTPAPPPGAVEPVDGLVPEVRPYSFHAEIDLSAPGADDATFQFEPGRVLSAAAVRRALRGKPGPPITTVDVRYRPSSPAAASAPLDGAPVAPESTVWINGVLAPEVRLEASARGGSDVPRGFHFARRDLWKNVWVVKR